MNPSTPNLSGFEHFLIVAAVIYLAIMVIMLIATVKIVTKAGYPGWWVAVPFIPLIGPFIGIVLFFVFAFSEWPIQRELAVARSRQGGGYASGPPGSPWAPPMPTPTPTPTPSYPPSGYGPTGYAPSGYAAPAADAPSGDVPSGDVPSGNRPSRYLSPKNDPPPPPPPPPSGGMV
jgi:energy-coupling factor transporter transmembrane protein EcfT